MCVVASAMGAGEAGSVWSYLPRRSVAKGLLYALLHSSLFILLVSNSRSWEQLLGISQSSGCCQVLRGQQDTLSYRQCFLRQ